jgi:hypothetical protein
MYLERASDAARANAPKLIEYGLRIEAASITATTATRTTSYLNDALYGFSRIPNDINTLIGRFADRPLDTLASVLNSFPQTKIGSAAVAGVGVAARTSFQSFSAFKYAMGPAGPGRHWHHIVEQTPGNVARFGEEAIHNTENLVRLDVTTHRQISAFYSSHQPQVTGSTSMTVREWLSTQSLQAHREFGQQALEQFRGLR